MATREYHRNYYHNVLKPKMLAYVGGDNPACAECGSNESLEFDHIDPDSKSFNIAKNPTVSNAAVRAELDKCQLLCSPCHKAKSVLESKKRREGTFTHGTIYAWMRKKCTCDECSTAKRAWNDARNEARRSASVERQSI